MGPLSVVSRAKPILNNCNSAPELQHATHGIFAKVRSSHE
jgi:hypothetical protein